VELLSDYKVTSKEKQLQKLHSQCGLFHSINLNYCLPLKMQTHLTHVANHILKYEFLFSSDLSIILNRR